MHKRSFVHSVVAVFLTFAFVASQGTLVLAGTTGGITGTVTDKATRAPLSGAKVTASSPSQVATTISDANGHFAFLSLAPDTYTLSLELPGYDPTSLAGVNVQSDQTQTIGVSAGKTLRTIGRVTSRTSGNLVRSGVTSDVYNVTPAQQAAAASLGGGNNLNAAYSAIASTPGTLVPISESPGWGQSVNIRGGDYTQTGYELDGIPINRAFDQYSGSPLSNIGNAEVQVYTGNQPADAQANGLAGFVNQVIKTGTYPGFSSAQLGIGSPAYYHKFSVETGGATQNRNFSYYLGFLGYNQQNNIIDQFNGVGVAPIYGTPINFIAANCRTANPSVGCYQNAGNASLFGLPLGPNGYVTAPTYEFFIPATEDREGVANVHIGIPHKHDGMKDDIQLLYNGGETYNTPNGSLLSYGSALGDVLNGTANNGAIPTDANGLCPSTSKLGALPPVGTGPLACEGGAQATYNDQNYYTGPLNTALTAANLGSIKNSFFAGSNTNRAFNANVPLNQGDTETTGFSVEKVQYQHNFSSNAYARVYGYQFYSDRIDNGIVGQYQKFASAFSTDYLISSHTRGVAALFADQVDPHNLIAFDAAYSYSNTSRNRNDVARGAGESPVAYLVDSARPTAGCYAAGGVPSTCDMAAQYVLPALGGGSLTPTQGSPSLATAATTLCGGAPCEYLAVNTGATGALNSVRPAFTNASISDTFKPIQRLTVNASLRYEDFTYNLQDTNTLGNQLLVNDYNNSHCVLGTTVTTRALGTACGTVDSPGVPTALSANSPPRVDYSHLYSPRFGLTYQFDPNTVVRASYGRFTQPAETSSVDATNIQSSVPSAAFFSNFGFASYARSVDPEISYNTDFSIEHALPKADMQFSISPFYRKTTDEFVAITVDPKTAFIANVNGLNRETKGIEFYLTKGSFARDGFAATLAYTYTYATAHYKVFPNGGSFVSPANTAIQAYNGYTKFCATNPKSGLCPSAGNVTVAASPCYTRATPATATVAEVPGIAAPCSAATVANPYWNSQPAGLIDPNSAFIPYNNSIGPGFGTTATSYIVPHVIALVVNYKKGPFSVTPSFQFQGGSRYGSPFVAQGVAPESCLTTLGSAVTGDPRYTFGSPGGGAPYNASSCSGLVTIPNPQTGHFDGIGEYVQPNLIATNVSFNYNFTKQLGINLVAANVFNRCFGGSRVPWGTGNIGCAYSQAGTYVGNSYNPGDKVQQFAAQSYTPVVSGSLQGVSAESPLPFELFMNLNLRL